MKPHTRPTLRGLFLSGEKRLDVFFYTSNEEKYLHAATVFERAGLILRYFRRKTDPYEEDYAAGKEILLTRAIAEILEEVGKQSLFFVEDTSLRIEALSSNDSDYPGLAVKEWFANTSFDQVDQALKERGGDRTAIVKSDIALHVPILPRPVFFHGSTLGRIAESPPAFAVNQQYPWLTPATFNGWFIPDGATRRLGEMTLEESWQFDFRTQAVEQLLQRLEEYSAILNLSPSSYSKPVRAVMTRVELLFPESNPVFIVVGQTCAGKSTFGERATQHGLHWIEASSVLRTLTSDYDRAVDSGFELAQQVLSSKGADVVARRILQYYSDRFQDGVVITGFRTIEELETIRSRFPDAQVVVIQSSERARYQRHLTRGRLEGVQTANDFRIHDQRQWIFGLLRVAEDFADVRIVNEGTREEFLRQVDSVLGKTGAAPIPGVSRHVHPRHGIKESQLYRCLAALDDQGRALSCTEIQTITGASGAVVRFNNVNKVLKAVPELAKRFELKGSSIRYEISSAGRAYVRYMLLKFGKPS